MSVQKKATVERDLAEAQNPLRRGWYRAVTKAKPAAMWGTLYSIVPVKGCEESPL